jgi:hypothetical protein
VSLALVAALSASGCGPKLAPAEAQAAAMIEKVGGRFELDERNSNPRIIKVSLNDTPVTDADLESLGQLAQLKSLYLGRTNITDAGLAHLQHLTPLQTLGLNNTAITDKGLEHLQGLKQLKTLNLHETAATSAGVAALQQALPSVKIAYSARK